MPAKAKAKETQVGNGVTLSVSEDKILTVTVDLKKDYGLSSSGKTIQIASTKGNKELVGCEGVVLGLNCYRFVAK